MNHWSLMSEDPPEPLTVFEVEVARGFGGPQPHGVDDVVPVAGDGRVVGQGQHHLTERRARWGKRSWKLLLFKKYIILLSFFRLYDIE